MMGKNSSPTVSGAMLFLMVITLFGGTNAVSFGISQALDDYVDNYVEDVVDNVDNYVHHVDNQIHDVIYPNHNVLMQWGVGVFVAIVIGIVVFVILIFVCCGCMCYHCCCKTSPPPYTTLVVAGNQPHPMVHHVQPGVNLQQAPFGQQQQPYVIKN